MSEYASPQSFELKKNIDDFKSGLVKKSKEDVAGIESLYEATKGQGFDAAAVEKTVISVRGDDIPKHLIAEMIHAIRPYLKDGVKLDWYFLDGKGQLEISRKIDQKTS